ncbi:MAG: DNA polymerase IV [Elusimicrobiota bacterium]
MPPRPHPADRIVLHADMDCFFAAVEEREDPSLRGKPVVVGSDPKAGHGRGIVATANYAARRCGIRSAMPISTAYRRCPRAAYLRPRHKLYASVSRKVMGILGARADVLEQVGIDEAYLDAGSLRTFEAARELARTLQAEVLSAEGLSVSIGVGPNKLVAKIASDHKKPGGITVVIPARVREFLDPKPVRVLRGVGPKTDAHLEGMGYRTVAQLREASEQRLVGEFGKFGGYLWREARGMDDSPVDPAWEAKSVGREHTFPQDTGDLDEVRDTLRACVRRVHRDLMDEGHWCHTLTVKVRFEGYETHSKQTTLKLPTGAREHLESGALSLIEPFLARGKRFRLVGFTASRLVPPEDLLPLR